MTARIVCLWLLVLLAAGEGQASPRPYDIPRPAGKRLADLQSGDPRTVRLVHFRPNDRPLRVEALAQLREMALKTQDFFAGQMEAHGFGRRTFRLETDGEGEPVVHQIEGRHPDSHYPADPHGVVFSEIGQVFNTRANVYLVLIDNSQGGRPRAVSTGKIGGQAAVFPSHTWRTAAHELGHAFGLDHDFRDGAYIMSYGSRPDRMSLCAAEYLSVHPLFNPAVPTGPGAAPSVELLSELEYPKGATTFAIDIEVSDPDGLHHLIVTMDTEGLHPAAGYPEVKACHSFDGRTEAVVEMEFDDDTPSYFASVSRRIHVKVLDTDGNVVKASYTLLESSAYKIASLQIDDHLVRSLAFSPDGTLLAAAGSGETELWDVDRRVLVRSLWGGDAVAFSPDGGALAAGYGPGAALIQDLETGRPTFFDGHNDFITSVAFSPDGRLLAVGARDGTLKLWDAASKPASLWSANEHPLFTLEGHAARITSLYFSRDSARLVSFSSSGNGARLWDVATGALTATLPPEGARWWIRAVALDPKGGILACASNDGRIRLLDVVSGEQLAVMRGSGWRLSFSPDGGILAASALDQTIHLWDVFAREEIAVFASGEVHALAFSPDGRILALAGNDGRFGLWDMSEWAGPRPRTLTKISGDLQQAPPGADL